MIERDYYAADVTSLFLSFTFWFNYLLIWILLISCTTSLIIASLDEITAYLNMIWRLHVRFIYLFIFLFHFFVRITIGKNIVSPSSIDCIRISDPIWMGSSTAHSTWLITGLFRFLKPNNIFFNLKLFWSAGLRFFVEFDLGRKFVLFFQNEKNRTNFFLWNLTWEENLFCFSHFGKNLRERNFAVWKQIHVAVEPAWKCVQQLKDVSRVYYFIGILRSLSVFPKDFWVLLFCLLFF